MRIGREYAFDMIQKVGQEVARNADQLAAPNGKKGNGTRKTQSEIADVLWTLQKKLSYRDYTPKEVLAKLCRLVEAAGPFVDPATARMLARFSE